MFEDVIQMLLDKKANLREEIEREFAARSEKIDALLDMAGYVAPVEEEVEESTDEEPAVDVVDGEQNSYSL